MRCPTLAELPPPPPDKTGWPWTDESEQLPEVTQQGIPWPKVSIVTPSYNQGQFLEASIRSVLLQGYSDVEYIIIDGGSSDESVGIIKRYAPWITFWVSEPDRGQSHAINKGLDKSTGVFFNWQNADDMLTKGSLQATAAAMVEHPEVSYTHGYRIVINREAHILYNTQKAFRYESAFAPDLHTSVKFLTAGMQTGCLMRRDLVLDVGKIDETLHYIMDRDILLRLALKAPPYYIDQPVVFLREYDEAKSFTWTPEQAKERFIIADKIFRQLDLPEDIRILKRSAYAAAHRFAWKCYGKSGKILPALRHVSMDVLYTPFDGWTQRRRIIKDLSTHHSSKWLYRTYRVMKYLQTLVSGRSHTTKGQQDC